MDAVQKANSGHPGHADGAGAARLRPLHAGHAAHTRPTRTGTTATASSSAPATPRCSCTHCLHLSGLRPHPRRPQELPPARQSRTPATPSTATPPASRSRPARSARASRNAVGFALARAHLAATFNRALAGDRRPLHVLRSPATATWRRASPARPASLAGHLGLGKLIAFYDDNHISIEGDTDLASPTTSASATRPTAGRSTELETTRRSERIEAALEEAKSVTDRPSLIILPHAHRLRHPQQAGHRRRARRAARRGRDQADQGGLRLSRTRSRSSSPTRSPSMFAGVRSAATRAEAEWDERLRGLRGPSTPTSPPSSSDHPPPRAEAARRSRTRPRRSRPATSPSPPARPRARR